MAKARKDNKGRALRKGESQRKYDLMYMYTYTDPYSKKRKYIYASDLVELRKKESTLIKNQLDGLDTYAAGESDLNFLFDRYISTKKNLRETTRSNYTYMYNHYVRQTLGKTKIGDLKYSDIVKFYQHLMHDKKLLPNTIDTIHTVIHPALDMAVKDNILPRNPSDGALTEIKKSKRKSKQVRHALTTEQQKAFLNFIDGHKVYGHWKPLFVIFIGTGCRVGEIIGLRWEDVDMANRVISINHAVTYYQPGERKGKSQYKISLPKTESGIRSIPMLPEVYEAFCEERTQQKTTGCFNNVMVDGMSGFVFCNRFGGMLNSQSLNRTIKNILNDYNDDELLNSSKEGRDPILLPTISCHHFRHTFCSRLCENDVNLKVIQSLMGHADIQTTLDIYTEVSENKKMNSINEFSKTVNMF